VTILYIFPVLVSLTEEKSGNPAKIYHLQLLMRFVESNRAVQVLAKLLFQRSEIKTRIMSYKIVIKNISNFNFLNALHI
jgi:hypothetical protein